jgi:RimJ/RimL family protein N-acetyltransferase
MPPGAENVLHRAIDLPTPTSHRRLAPGLVIERSWPDALPTLEGEGVRLRELRRLDSVPLHAMLATDRVSRYIAPPPATPSELAQFIARMRRQRAQGRRICFGVIPRNADHPVGMFQVWRLDGTFDIAEWGFALGAPFWGSGVFMEAAQLVLRFAFETLEVKRLEARAACENGRGNGALRKIGATTEGILRQCFNCRGQRTDHVMWGLLAEEWRGRHSY